MQIYDYAFEKDKWERFYESYSSNEHVYKADVKKLRAYIDSEKYLEVLRTYEITGEFSIPELIMLNKKEPKRRELYFPLMMKLRYF